MDKNEKKLVLLKSIRDEQHENILRLQRREKILYPDQDISYRSLELNNYDNPAAQHYTHTKAKEHESYEKFKKNYKAQSKNSFLLRFCLALFVFLSYIYISNHKIEILNYNVADIQEILTDDLDLKSFAFMEQFSYTLKGLED